MVDQYFEASSWNMVVKSLRTENSYPTKWFTKRVNQLNILKSNTKKNKSCFHDKNTYQSSDTQEE